MKEIFWFVEGVLSEIIYNNEENIESRVKHLKFLLSQFWKRFYNKRKNVSYMITLIVEQES